MSPFLLLAALVPAVFLMVQVYRLDRIEKEPPGLLLKLVLFGALSGLAAGVVEGALTRALEVLLSGSALRLVIENFLAVALVEEACKRWVVMKFAWNHPAFDYRFDAVVYCVFAALGFAALENILYVAQFGFAVAVSRALLSVPGHCFFAVYMGIYLGQAKMVEAIRYGRSLGYHMDMHINQNNFYRSAKRWNLADVAKDRYGQPIKYTVYPGGQVYRSCFEVICNRYCDKDMDDMASFGINGLFHVDVTSATAPIPCHDPRHPNSRARMAEWQKRIGEKARARFGGFSSECGIDHVAPILDNVLYVSSYPGWHSPKTELVEGCFPVWHVAYSGIILSNPFYATIDAPYPREGSGRTDAVGPHTEVTGYLGTPARRTLKVFELNGRPMFYYADYRDLAPMKRMYDLWQPLKHLQFAFIREHVELAPDVFATRYENGEEVVVNYTASDFAYRGRAVKPLAYELYASAN